MNAVDTNVFVYRFDADEPMKQKTARELLNELSKSPSDTVTLWQVAAEFLACLRKWESSGKITGSDVDAHFDNVMGLFELRVPSPPIFAISFDLHSRFSLSHWDSLLLAACKTAGVDLLYTEDLDAGTDYDGIKIVNPFA